MIVSTANAYLAMSGGVNGAILLQGGEAVARELQDHLRSPRRRFVEPGTVLVTSPGPLNAKHILHAVSVNAFYESSPALVAQTLREVWRISLELRARTIALPALATGYGPLSMSEFADGVRASISDHCHAFDEIRIVLRKSSDVAIVLECLGKQGP